MRAFLVFIPLLLLGVVNGLTVNIDNVLVGDDLVVNYSIILNKPELTSYSLVLFNERNHYLLFNNSRVFSELSDSVSIPVSSLAAGIYNLSLIVSNPSVNISEFYSSSVIVRGSFDFNIVVPDEFFIGLPNEVIVDNLGNTDLSVSLYFTGARGELSVNPQSFYLLNHDSRVVSVNALSDAGFNASLVVNVVGLDSFTRVFNVSFLQPVIEVNYSFNKSVVGNDSVISFVINNSGNLPVNASLRVRGFSFSDGFIVNESVVSAPVGISFVNLSLPKSLVVGVGLSYEGFNGSVSDYRSLSFIDGVPFNVKLTRERLLLLVVLLLLLSFYVFLKLKRHRRP